jgi:hypothetical protein
MIYDFSAHLQPNPQRLRMYVATFSGARRFFVQHWKGSSNAAKIDGAET